MPKSPILLSDLQNTDQPQLPANRMVKSNGIFMKLDTCAVILSFSDISSSYTQFYAHEYPCMKYRL